MKSVYGHAVEMMPGSGPGQLLALTASKGQAGKVLGAVWRFIGYSLQWQLPFVSGRTQRGLKSSTVCCQNPSRRKGTALGVGLRRSLASADVGPGAISQLHYFVCLRHCLTEARLT